MFGLTKRIEKEMPKPVATLAPDELMNLLEQSRLVLDAHKVHHMLRMTYQATLHKYKEKYKLPDEFEFDKNTGECFAKESGNG